MTRKQSNFGDAFKLHKREEKTFRQAQRHQNGLLKNLYNDSVRIADGLKEKSKSMAYNAIGFSDEKTLGDTFLGPVGGFIAGKAASAGLHVAAIPFATAAEATRLAAATMGRRIKP